MAREGDSAPGTDVDVNFGNFFSSSGLLVLNGNGQTAFAASLTGTGVDDSNDSAIFAEDLVGNLQLIVRTGDLLDVSDDPLTPDLRVISSLSFVVDSGNEDGRGSGFNDLGQLAFLADFTDGSNGIFVSDLVAIPEPNSLFLALFATSLLLSRRRELLRMGY